MTEVNGDSLDIKRTNIFIETEDSFNMNQALNKVLEEIFQFF